MPTTTNILTPAFTCLLLCIAYALLWMTLCSDHTLPPLGIDVGNPVIDVTPRSVNVPYEGSKEVLSCVRVPVSGVSRLKLQHYASMYNVTLAPSVLIPKRWHGKIVVCFHRNSSLGLCQCEKDDWKSLQNGLWISTMSPYEQKFIDVKFGGMVTGSVTVSLEEVQQRWRYILLTVGIVLLFLAPVVSEWVPFYYASSIVIGIITVVLIILYQARIFLPTGRRNTFYLAIMCSVIGAGSFVLHHLSAFLKSFLINFGMSPEIQNLVSPLTKTGWACDVYSTFHKTPNRKKFSEEEWQELTEESTRQSVTELASSPEFTDWVINNSGRIKLLREDSSDDLDESESSSSNGYVQQTGNRPGFFNWFMCR